MATIQKDKIAGACDRNVLSTFVSVFFAFFGLFDQLLFKFFCTLLIKLFFELINFSVTHFLNLTTGCEVAQAVSVWQVSQPISDILFKGDVILSFSLIVEKGTENFLEAKCVVTMASKE